MSGPKPSIVFLHTHFIPDQLCGSSSGIIVAEQSQRNLGLYHGLYGTGDIRLRDFFEKCPRSGDLSFAVEGDYDPAELVSEIDYLYQIGVRYVLPWHFDNPSFFSDGKLTDSASDLLWRMDDLGMALDCTHLPKKVFELCREKFSGAIVFSHSVFRLPHMVRGRMANELDPEMVESISSRAYLIGIPVVDDIVSPCEPTLKGATACVRDIADQIFFAVKQFGVEHVCLGADYFNFKYYGEKMGCVLGVVPSMDTVAGYEMLEKELLHMGLSNGDVQKVFSDNVKIFDALLNADRKQGVGDTKYWTFSENTEKINRDAAERGDLTFDGHPTHAWLALSNYCNLSCKHCRRTYREQKEIERDISDVLYERYFVEVIPGLNSLIIGGNNFAEITKAARFDRFVSDLSALKAHPQVSIQTNGSVIKKDTLEKLVELNTAFNISVEGGIEATARKIRGLGLGFVRDRINEINQMRCWNRNNASRVVLSFTAMKSTIEELLPLVEFAEFNGVDEVNVLYLLPPTSDWNHEGLHDDALRVNRIIEEAKLITESWHVKVIAPTIEDVSRDGACMRPWTSASVDAYGDVRFCCLNESPIIGNLSKDHLMDIWNSGAAKKIRSEINSSPQCECACCVLRNFPVLSSKVLRAHMK